MARVDIDRLLDKIRRNPNNCRNHDIGRILQEYGFEAVKGRRNIVYQCKDHPDLRMEVPRRQHLKAWVGNDTLKLVDKIIQRERKEIKP